MSIYHVIATLPGGSRKAVTNRTEAAVVTEFVIPFEETGTITTRWGSSVKRRQALELRVYRTETRYDRRTGTFDEFVKNRKNRYSELADRVRRRQGAQTRVFIVMPIQGEKFGTQEDQRVYKEYDDRFMAIEEVLDEVDAYGIRVDKEAPLDGLVDRIKQEIRDAQFLIIDLTDERPSCYFEAGFADALAKPAIYIASKQSVIHPGTDTVIHFDIHRAINFFTNHDELKEKIRTAYAKNQAKLLATPEQQQAVIEPAS